MVLMIASLRDHYLEINCDLLMVKCLDPMKV